jgi:ribosome biogenesis SPOUT family RNA methylase Rps3
MSEKRIIGINVLDRIKEAGRTQKVLSKYATSVKTRLGFHELSEDVCSRNGFIILELTGEISNWDNLENELNEIGGINVQKMSFDLNQ